jgi:SAM-dependent methyltransferase
MVHTGSAIHPSAAQGFARAPAAYERGRPDYPDAAIDRLLQVLGIGPGRRVLDLAAGTGKLTRRLVAAGAEVVAVEPVAEMRAKLATAVPQAEPLEGTAEAIPLPAGCVDGIAVGQGFHWFDGEAALAEIHRVLRPGRRLGLIWNGREESDAFARALTEIMEPYRGNAPAFRSGAWRKAFETTALFTPLEEERFHFEHELDPDGVVARVASVSFIAALPKERRAEVVGRVRELLASEGATRGRGRIVLPYWTDVYWCERR